jgi:ribose transport system ATP-binding protein
MTALALEGVSRRFGPVQVLHDLDLGLIPGEVHALIGENGAGKSTAMKILAGYLRPSEGRVLRDGAPADFTSAKEAESAGIIMIHQEFNLAQALTVEENVFLGRELCRGPFLDRRAMRTETRRLLERLDCPVDPSDRIADISVSNRQMVEIAKAMGRDARVLIMDEPTAVLTGRETAILFDHVRRLRGEGVAILYTSHKLHEIAEIADRVTILRDGRKVTEAAAGTLDQDQMAEAMVGRALSNLYPAKGAPGAETVLEVRGLSVPGHVADASFSLRRGEVLGVAGLMGAGRTELMEGVVGLRPSTGEVRVAGALLPRGSVQAARDAGLVYLTEDRKEKGLLLDGDLRSNLTLMALAQFSRLFIDEAAEDRALTEAIAEFDIRAGDRDMRAGDLSGGNQQKLLLAKTMLVHPEIVIIDEPTRGIDVGTKQQIYAFIAALAERGKSVIVVSSEMQEVIGLSSRVIVMTGGRIAGELDGPGIGERAIVRLAMGMSRERADA